MNGNSIEYIAKIFKIYVFAVGLSGLIYYPWLSFYLSSLPLTLLAYRVGVGLSSFILCIVHFQEVDGIRPTKARAVWFLKST